MSDNEKLLQQRKIYKTNNIKFKDMGENLVDIMDGKCSDVMRLLFCIGVKQGRYLKGDPVMRRLIKEKMEIEVKNEYN